jgi:hypothetical protein
MCICDRAAYSAGKESFVKKIFVFFLAALALFVFAIPAIASPPLGAPVFEAVGPALGTYQAFQVAPEVAVTAIDSGGLSLAANYFEIVQARENIPTLTVSLGIAPTLAGLMCAASSARFNVSAYHFNPRSRFQALARDQTVA